MEKDNSKVSDKKEEAPKREYASPGIRISSSYGKTPGGFWGFPIEQEPISVNYRKKRK